ncbi:uncharacterized protein CYBJADRAFT_64579 [Cyberlindnera jadinii NRRL Y-1542]|uniref:Uncharacterized protein n=1 Tax=Cyberlindnera jadinii (strain ATCC 18201 / CBS 1600 / BCRC 20928 / JCM 3617 / NBRC 0987 / NRRL Y-1542) TaxID=983966 RepID=A0A1E4S695_CYBJN|nr:hypothetical protein CYBJADRAFT_64579 [Cyberlindnera jadinii NRRL Y-1542]ODV74912.1 hypothetical protein CYBJADRAFT_64579 [Cyberlindnera jadinii NRRL Y-1542]
MYDIPVIIRLLLLNINVVFHIFHSMISINCWNWSVLIEASFIHMYKCNTSLSHSASHL